MRKIKDGVELTHSENDRLGLYLIDLIRSAETSRLLQDPLWEGFWKAYENEPTAFMSNYVEGATDHVFPLLQPRVDALGDAVIGAIFGAKPVATAMMVEKTGDGPADKKAGQDLQKLIEFVCEQGQLKERSKEGVAEAAVSNHLIFRLTFDAGHNGDGIEATMLPSFEIVSPKDFVAVQPDRGGIKKASLVGHTFERRKGEIARLIRSKVYMDLPEGSDSFLKQAGATTTTATRVEDEAVKLWSVVFRLNLEAFLKEEDESKENPKLYGATVGDDGRVYRLEEYDYKRPMYATIGLLPHSGKSFWSRRSIARNLISIHHSSQAVENLRLWGSVLLALPAAYGGPDQTKNADKFRKIRPLEVREVLDAEKMAPIGTQFNPEVLISQSQALLMAADGTIRISQAGLAQNFSKDNTTATEAAQVAGGQQLGISGYVDTFSAGLVDVFECIVEMLRVHLREWYPLYEGMVGPLDVAVLDRKAVFEVTGRNPATLPGMAIAELERIAAIAMSVPGGPERLKEGDFLMRVANASSVPDASELFKTDEEMNAEIEAEMAFESAQTNGSLANPAMGDGPMAEPGLQEAEGQFPGGDPGFAEPTAPAFSGL